MKHLPKVLLPIAMLLFVFHTANAQEPTLDEAVPVGIGASAAYVVGGGWLVAGAGLTYIVTTNGPVTHDCYYQDNVKVPAGMGPNTYQEITACEHQGVTEF